MKITSEVITDNEDASGYIYYAKEKGNTWNLNIKNAYGNKAFLKTKRPSFSGKKLNSNTIMMLIGKIV